MYSINSESYVETSFDIKKSRFITQVYRVNSVIEAREKIILAKRKYPDARHYCTAFNVIENGIEIFRSNDDGEPSGTAGKPMLEVLKGSSLKNILFITIRYFGGIKLGTGGLVNAYTKSVKDAIAECFAKNKIVEIVKTNVYSLKVRMDNFGKINSDIYGKNINVYDVFFKENYAQFLLRIPDKQLIDTKEYLSNILQKKVILDLYTVDSAEIPVDKSILFDKYENSI